MNYQDEDVGDDMFSFDDVGFGIGDPQSPLGNNHSLHLTIPVRDRSPVSPSRDLDDGLFGFGDSSLSSIPMRDIPFAGDPPRLSPMSSAYQHMQPSQSYEQPQIQMEVPYNSFEQPVAVINGEYSHASGSPMTQQMDPNAYYQDLQQPSTSSHSHVMVSHQQQSHPSQSHTVSHQQQQRPPSQSGQKRSSMMHQMLSTPSASARQPPAPNQPRPSPGVTLAKAPPSQPRQRAIQPKTHHGRKKQNSNTMGDAGGDMSSTSSNNRMAGGGGAPSAPEVRLTSAQVMRLANIQNELNQLELQQTQLGINNRDRIEELKKQQADIFLNAIDTDSQQVGGEVINQLHQIKQQPGVPTPRNTPRPRQRPPQSRPPPAQHHSQPQMLQQTPDSPQYQPQMYMTSQSQPSTSQVGAVYHEYPSSVSGPPVIVSQSPVHHIQQQSQQLQQQAPRMYRVATVNTQQQNHHQQQQQQHNIQVTTAYQSGGSHSQPVYVQQQQRTVHATQFATPSPTPTILTTVDTPVGQLIRQSQRTQMSTQRKPATRQVILQPHVVVSTGSSSSPAPIQIQTQPPKVVYQPPPQPKPQPVKLTAVQMARRIEDKRASRLFRLQDAIHAQQVMMGNPDTETPFIDPKDALFRLLPFHFATEPDMKDEEFEQFDCNYLRKMINLNDGKKKLERRLQNILFKEAERGREGEERNLLLYLETEYEKRKLDEEKAFVNDTTRESFVESSTIIPALRGCPPPQPSNNKTQPKLAHFYEYHPFTESPRAISPYKSPSPIKSPASSIRSLSPLKSPTSSINSPRLRDRPSLPPLSTPLPKETPKQRPPPRPRVSSPEKKPTIAGARSRRPSVRASEDEEEKKVFSLPTSAPAPPPPLTLLPTPPHKVPGRLPAKKELLSRARLDIPLALRSPPSQPTRPPAVSSRSVDSDDDGSCSPELGLDDDCSPVLLSAPSLPPPPPTTTFANLSKTSTSKVETAFATAPIQPKPREAPCPPVPSIAVSKPSTPPKQPSTRTVSPTVEAPAEKVRFKPQVPRPSKSHQDKIRALRNEEEQKNSVTGSLEQQKPAVNKSPLRPEMKIEPIVVNPISLPAAEQSLPPIRLTIKRSGPILAISKEKDRNENNCNAQEGKSEKRDKKKKKKKKRKREREECEKRREERMKPSESPEPAKTPKNVEIVPTEGLRFKIRFNKAPNSVKIENSSPSTSTSQSENIPMPAVNRNRLAPASSKDEPPLKVPKLKIRFGAPPVKVSVSEPVMNAPLPVSEPPAPAPLEPVRNGPGSSASLLQPVTFSDDSDSEAERVRSSTDNALRGLGLKTGLLGFKTVPTAPLLPWSSDH